MVVEALARHPRPRNLLLVALPQSDYRRLISQSQEISLRLSAVVIEPNERVRHVYFPLDSFVSLIQPIDHRQLEVGLIGSEGMVGTPIALGVASTPLRGVVQGSGKALRLTAGAFRRELDASEALRRVMARYIHILSVQLAQANACSQFHTLNPRLARWLLMMRDRAHDDRFAITHEFMAMMLGVRRSGVSEAAGALQRRGLVSYVRGVLTILDAVGLERTACSCYPTDLRTYERVLGRPRPPT